MLHNARLPMRKPLLRENKGHRKERRRLLHTERLSRRKPLLRENKGHRKGRRRLLHNARLQRIEPLLRENKGHRKGRRRLLHNARLPRRKPLLRENRKKWAMRMLVAMLPLQDARLPRKEPLKRENREHRKGWTRLPILLEHERVLRERIWRMVVLGYDLLKYKRLTRRMMRMYTAMTKTMTNCPQTMVCCLNQTHKTR